MLSAFGDFWTLLYWALFCFCYIFYVTYALASLDTVPGLQYYQPLDCITRNLDPLTFNYPSPSYGRHSFAHCCCYVIVVIIVGLFSCLSSPLIIHESCGLVKLVGAVACLALRRCIASLCVTLRCCVVLAALAGVDTVAVLMLKPSRDSRLSSCRAT